MKIIAEKSRQKIYAQNKISNYFFKRDKQKLNSILLNHTNE